MNTKCNREEFIRKSEALYGKGSFDYSLVDYINGYTEITLICKKHGKFDITPNKHLDIKGGCPKCSKEKRKKRQMMSNDDYKALVIQKHGNKYDLSKVEYKGMRDYVTATCPIHGDFKIIAYDFVNKRGCNKCGIEDRAKKVKEKKRPLKRRDKLTTEDFIKEATKIFGDKYSYSKTDLNKRDNKKRVCIICSKHGVFWQNPFSHLHGHGCELCGKEEAAKTQRMGTEEFIQKAKKIHNNKYDYSLTKYNGCYEDVEITCPVHGKFFQKAYVHLLGSGCPKCRDEKNSGLLLSNTEDFIEKAREIHGEEYDYSQVVYKGAKVPVTIICSKGHIFSQIPNKHLSGHGCPYCANNISKPEKEIVEYLKSFNVEVKTNSRKELDGSSKELDIMIPSKKLAIEYDGLYWHNEKRQPKDYHLQKTIDCNKQGLRLIHIFEDEWLYKKEIVKSRLNAILGLCTNRIGARECTIQEINNKTCKEFLEENHIQGNVNSSIRYGLFYENELVSVMTFCKPRKNLGQEGKNKEYELLRFCNKLNTIVVGGASKLFQHFIKQYNPKSIISYADRRWNTGQVYENMGFIFTHFSAPNYFYIIGQRRYNRFGFRKDILVKQGFDPSKSEHQIMSDRGIYRIYDCGCMCYKWEKN